MTNNFYSYFYPIEAALHQEYTEAYNFKTQHFDASTEVRADLASL